MDATIRSGQVRLAALIWIFFILTIMSVFVELVNGYCIGGGAAGVTWSAMPHGVWQIPNLVVAVFVLQAIYFDCNLDMEANVTSLLVIARAGDHSPTLFFAHSVSAHRLACGSCC